MLSWTDSLQVVPTTCYRRAIQQFVNTLWVTTLWQLDKITALLQLVDKLATSLLRTHLVALRPNSSIKFGTWKVHRLKRALASTSFVLLEQVSEHRKKFKVPRGLLNCKGTFKRGQYVRQKSFNIVKSRSNELQGICQPLHT